MKAYRMNGAGNAFVMLDARERTAALTPSEEQVRVLAALHPFDQLLALEADPDTDARLRVWNADGGEVGACGNGTRAAAWLMFQESRADTLTLSSLGGPMAARRLAEDMDEVDLGSARLDWREIPLSREMDTTKLDFAVDLPGGGQLSGPGAVSMGNPHAVFFVDDVEVLPLNKIGPKVEHDPLFPERVNAGFAQVRGRDSIRLRVFERGAGLTLACGTGAAAALVAAHRRGFTDREALVEADGGVLPVRWDAHGHVHLAGPVELEAEVELPEGW